MIAPFHSQHKRRASHYRGLERDILIIGRRTENQDQLHFSSTDTGHARLQLTSKHAKIRTTSRFHTMPIKADVSKVRELRDYR